MSRAFANVRTDVRMCPDAAGERRGEGVVAIPTVL